MFKLISTESYNFSCKIVLGLAEAQKKVELMYDESR